LYWQGNEGRNEVRKLLLKNGVSEIGAMNMAEEERESI
jgi:hypothetical protein